ncbi:MAG: helix-turn-helix domain-containing protein [Ferruginibacter sp.]
MLFVIGISIAFFLDFVLISKKRKTLADKVLVVWLFFIAVHLLLFYLHISGKSFEMPWLLGIHIPMPLLHGPFLFLYTGTLTNQLSLKRKIWLIHFIPVIASWLYLLTFYVLPAEQKIFIFKHKGRGHETFMFINLIAIYTSGILYILGSTLLLRRHRFAILNQFSYTEKINLRWLQYLIYGLAIIWLAVFLDNDEVVFTLVVAFIVFIGYFGIKQVGIFSYTNQAGHTNNDRVGNTGDKKNPVRGTQTGTIEEVTEAIGIPVPGIRTGAVENTAEENPVEINIDKRKYSKSGLTEESAGNLHKELTRLMETEKLYMGSELTLTDLARRLDTHPNYLSQVINEKEEKNLYDYINTLRIDAFKKLIADPANQRYTILSLAYECGFNSKSSFNRYFKKVTGESPSDYMRRQFGN